MAHASPHTRSAPAGAPADQDQTATATQRAVQHLLREGNVGDLLHVVAHGVGHWLQGHLAAALTSALHEAVRPANEGAGGHALASLGRSALSALAQGSQTKRALSPSGAGQLLSGAQEGQVEVGVGVGVGEGAAAWEAGPALPHFEGLVSTAQAAAMAGVTPGTIRRWRRLGRLRSVGKGRSLLFLADEVCAAMRAGDPLACEPGPGTPDTPCNAESRQAHARRMVQELMAVADGGEVRSTHGPSTPDPAPGRRVR